MGIVFLFGITQNERPLSKSQTITSSSSYITPAIWRNKKRLIKIMQCVADTHFGMESMLIG